MAVEEAGRAPRVRILIAEDQALVRRGTAVLLARRDAIRYLMRFRHMEMIG
jgi:DNA-binding NarL/FixJ family response regulator